MEIMVKIVLPIVILAIGLIGNLFGLFTALNKKLAKIGPTFILKCLFLMDTVYLLQIIGKILIFGFGIDLDIIYSLFCKLYQYISYSMAPQSPWLLSYISIERVISIKSPVRKNLFRNKKSQIIFFVLLNAFNILYYIPFAFYHDLVISHKNETQIITCRFVSPQSQTVLSVLDFVNLLLIPFLIMLICSIVMSQAIFTSGRRAISNYSNGENKRFHRDIRLAITSISLNIIFLILSLPIGLLFYFTSDLSSNAFILFYNIFYASYAINFYVFLVTNSLFRRTFLDFFCCKASRKMNSENVSVHLK
jgi:hypothetical protein